MAGANVRRRAWVALSGAGKAEVDNLCYVEMWEPGDIGGYRQLRPKPCFPRAVQPTFIPGLAGRRPAQQPE